MAGRFSRSWSIFKASAAVLGNDKRLLVFPLISTLAAILAAAGCGLVYAWWSGLADGATAALDTRMPYVLGFIYYFLLYTVIVFFNTALVFVAANHLDGGAATPSEGLRFARSKIGVIIGYAAIAATVGVVLRFLEDRLGTIGEIIVGLANIAWTVATFLVVPVLVYRDIGPVDAVKESARLLKDTWGENIIANGGMGVVFMILYLPLGILAILVTFSMLLYQAGAGYTIGEWAIVISAVVAAWLPLLLVVALHGALQGIYSAALYRYATLPDEESADGPISNALLDSAFTHKKRKSRR
jgi:hypothetical protein